jgi:hypothetical protein
MVFSFLNIASFSLFFVATTAKLPTSSLDSEALRIDDTRDRFNYDVNLDSLSVGGLETSTVGDTKLWLSLDDYNGFYFFTEFELRAESANTEIWVQTLPDRLYPEGHPCNDPAYIDEDGFYNYPEITQAQIDYLLLEFDNNIYPTDTLYYGNPDFHDGTYSLLEAWGYVPPGYYYDEDGRNVILVSNVRDAAYYTDFRFYIAGFFSSSIEAYMDRNVISIDTHQWYRRIGPEGQVWHSEILDIDYPPVDRPHLYEGTIAHEYQHLLHRDYAPNDPLYMNEGFSMFAEFLCGYGVPWGDINYFLATPDNSLTEWGDQEGDNNILADYGQAFLWTAYLSDHFGGSDFVSYYMENGHTYWGVEGIENAVAHFGEAMEFDQLFLNWRLANLMHTNCPGGGMYNYFSFDLGEADIPVRVYDVDGKWPQDVTGSGFGHTVCWDDFPLYSVFLVGSYGTDYVRVDNPRGGFFSGFEFNGDDTATVPQWQYLDDGTWYSTYSDEIDLFLMVDLDLTGMADAIILTFDTMYLIEPNWDFGFVQVYDEVLGDWVSLENEYTTYDFEEGAYPTVQQYVPGLTGFQEEWINMGFDISAYGGSEITLAFRFVTDWVFGPSDWGWWVDNVALNGEPITDDLFYVPDAPDTDFMVTLLRVDYWKGRPIYSIVYDVDIDHGTEEGMAFLFPFSIGRADMIVLISPTLGPADYSFSLNKHTFRPNCRWMWRCC